MSQFRHHYLPRIGLAVFLMLLIMPIRGAMYEKYFVNSHQVYFQKKKTQTCAIKIIFPITEVCRVAKAASWTTKSCPSSVLKYPSSSEITFSNRPQSFKIVLWAKLLSFASSSISCNDSAYLSLMLSILCSNRGFFIELL